VSEPVIRVEGLGKRYAIGERARYLALRDVLARAFNAPLRLWRRPPREHIWALKDVGFEVGQGEVVGIIGRNGAGKTTLLKLLSRITRPTEGFAEVRGRIGSLLEVGTGFHPELTGRENVFLSGAILGMSKEEIRRRFDEIVAFAEVEKFIDTPLKHYSSGMEMRLAFAVAAHLEPEILLVDEVLAVGDINFQKKCLGKMGDVARTGRTVVLVSHQLNQIRRLCQRVLWIDGGELRKNGPTHEVASAYESAMARGDSNGAQQHRGAATKGRFLKWEVVEPRAEDPNILSGLCPVRVKFTVEVKEPINHGHHGCALYNHERQLIWAWATSDLMLQVGVIELCYDFPMLPLRPGPYTWAVSLYDDGEEIDAWECLPEMVVATEVHQHTDDQWNGMLNMPAEFNVCGKG
jgi:lipopolysaccharide transport system ATP-binding protein